ncbi:cobalamin biosynthesis protein [Tabrizicola flagellatus]|uniref:cobalamin biosynthesis protein n=1 Tax=Tabrizicola flagellatus TaxID=2593021 RepID=UPI0011F1B9AA|nr:cobalamin biosynthesis protein [Tabrizicola flagellatus]
MIVAGFGFRSGASGAALREALARAGGAAGVTHLATVQGKAGGLADLGRELGLPVIAVPDAALRGQETVTQSQRVAARFGTGSLAEAAALAAAGPGARLRGPRAVSADGMATAAIAEGAA